MTTAEMVARIMALETEVRRLTELAAVSSIQSGRVRSYHDQMEMDGHMGSLNEILCHGEEAVEAYKVDRALLRVGDSSLGCMDERGRTGRLGVALGVSGRFLSLVDTLPAGQTVEVV